MFFKDQKGVGPNAITGYGGRKCTLAQEVDDIFETWQAEMTAARGAPSTTDETITEGLKGNRDLKIRTAMVEATQKAAATLAKSKALKTASFKP